MKEKIVKKEERDKNKYHGGGAAGAVYGLGFIGAFVYYIQNSQTFVEGVIGFFKALVWPAFLIHKVLGVLGM